MIYMNKSIAFVLPNIGNYKKLDTRKVDKNKKKDKEVIKKK